MPKVQKHIKKFSFYKHHLRNGDFPRNYSQEMYDSILSQEQRKPPQVTINRGAEKYVMNLGDMINQEKKNKITLSPHSILKRICGLINIVLGHFSRMVPANYAAQNQSSRQFYPIFSVFFFFSDDSVSQISIALHRPYSLSLLCHGHLNHQVWPGFSQGQGCAIKGDSNLESQMALIGSNRQQIVVVQITSWKRRGPVTNRTRNSLLGSVSL